MMKSTINTWHVVISGFLQERGAANGMYALWRKLHEQFASGESHVALSTWNDNHAALAEMIWRSGNGRSPVVKIYAYSWGAGHGAVRLAKELGKRGVEVRAMVLSDPVYRSPYAAFRWLALLPWRAITIPKNVRAVKWFRQRENKPAGHDLVAEDQSRTTIHEPWVVEDVIHHYMDDHHEFHLVALLVARQEYEESQPCNATTA